MVTTQVDQHPTSNVELLEPNRWSVVVRFFPSMLDVERWMFDVRYSMFDVQWKLNVVSAF
jgi:hypothetical protein